MPTFIWKPWFVVCYDFSLPHFFLVRETLFETVLQTPSPRKRGERKKE